MKARRMAYWWFRFVVSGRFLEKFLRLRRPWIHRRDDGRIPVSSPQPDDLSLRAMPRHTECRVGAAAWTRAPNGSESRRFG